MIALRNSLDELGYCPKKVCKLPSSYICSELKIKERTMKLTREQRLELISEMASSEAGFNELVRVLLESFST